MKPDILLIGGGGHCRSVLDVIEQENKFNISGIVDLRENVGKKLLGYPIVGCDDDLEKLKGNCDYAVITLGQLKTAELRRSIFRKLKELGYKLPTIISPRAYVSKHASLGEGTVVMHGAIVNACAVVGDNCIINTKALLEHDVIVGDHCHISTAAVVNGGVTVGEGTFYGSNAVSRQSIEIPSESFVKAGSVVK